MCGHTARPVLDICLARGSLRMVTSEALPSFRHWIALGDMAPANPRHGAEGEVEQPPAHRGEQAAVCAAQGTPAPAAVAEPAEPRAGPPAAKRPRTDKAVRHGVPHAEEERELVALVRRFSTPKELPCKMIISAFMDLVAEVVRKDHSLVSTLEIEIKGIMARSEQVRPCQGDAQGGGTEGCWGGVGCSRYLRRASSVQEHARRPRGLAPPPLHTLLAQTGLLVLNMTKTSFRCVPPPASQPGKTADPVSDEEYRKALTIFKMALQRWTVPNFRAPPSIGEGQGSQGIDSASAPILASVPAQTQPGGVGGPGASGVGRSAVPAKARGGAMDESVGGHPRQSSAAGGGQQNLTPLHSEVLRFARQAAPTRREVKGEVFLTTPASWAAAQIGSLPPAPSGAPRHRSWLSYSPTLGSHSSYFSILLTDMELALRSLAEVAMRLWPHSQTMLFGSQVRYMATVGRSCMSAGCRLQTA